MITERQQIAFERRRTKLLINMRATIAEFNLNPSTTRSDRKVLDRKITRFNASIRKFDEYLA